MVPREWICQEALSGRAARLPLAKAHSLFKTFVAVCYGPYKVAHPWTGGGERKDVARVRFTDDWASRPGIQRSIRQNPAAASIASLYQTACLPEHQLGL